MGFILGQRSRFNYIVVWFARGLTAASARLSSLFMLKLIYAAIPFIFASSLARAQDKQPLVLTSPLGVGQIESPTPRPEKPVALSKRKLKMGDHLIVPGKRIGVVALDMTLGQVERMFGSPIKTTKMYEDMAYSVWRWTKRTKSESHLVFFCVICQKERVIQIETNHPAFALSNGLSVQSSEEEWTAFWGEKPSRYSAMLSIAGSPSHVNWKKQGFALQVSNKSRFSDSQPKTQSVIVVPQGQLAKSTWGIWSFVSLVPSQSQTVVNNSK